MLRKVDVLHDAVVEKVKYHANCRLKSTRLSVEGHKRESTTLVLGKEIRSEWRQFRARDLAALEKEDHSQIINACLHVQQHLVDLEATRLIDEPRSRPVGAPFQSFDLQQIATQVQNPCKQPLEGKRRQMRNLDLFAHTIALDKFTDAEGVAFQALQHV